MERLGPRVIGLLGVIAVFTLPPLWLLFGTSLTFVSDPHDVTSAARLAWSGGVKEMHRLPWGGYVVSVDGDAHIEVTCRDGRVSHGGYVTGMLADDYEITRNCEIEWAD